MADKTVTYRLAADITGFRAQMAQAGASVKAAANEMTGATAKGFQFRSGLNAVGAVAGRIGLAAAGGLGAAVAVAANFDQAMSKVQAATHESAAGMDALRAAALKAGAETAFSASDAAGGIEALAKAGVRTKDILGGGLRGALSLAAAGELDVGSAAEDAATAMTQFGLKGKDVPHIADLLAAAAGKAQGEVSDFAQALNQAGLVANQTGLSIEETMGAFGAFASKGLLGSDAGTSLKTFLLSLSGNSAAAKETMDKLGFSAYDANGKFIGLAKTAEELRTSFGNLSAEQRTRDMKQIFGTDAVRAATVLYDQGAKGVQGWIKKVNDSGFAAETAATKLDNLKGDLEGLKGSLETALIGTGEGAQAPLRGLVQGLTNVVNAYNKLPASTQGGVAKALGITALAGISTFVFAKVVTGISNARIALQDLGLTAARTRTAIAGLGPAATLMAAGFAIDKIQQWQDEITHAKLSAEDLHRSLLQLATGVPGGTTIFQTYGKDLSGLGDDFDTLQSKTAHVDNFFARIVGAITPFAGSSSELLSARDNFKAMDEELAHMAEGGETRQAGEAFARIQAQARKAGVSTKQLAEIFPQYTAAVQNAGNSARFTEPQMKALAQTLGLTARQAERALRGLQDFSAFFAHREDIRSYHDALRGLTQSVRENGNVWKGFGAKANANNRSLDQFGQTAIRVAQDLKGAARQRFLTNAIQDLHQFAKDQHIPQAAIQGIVQRLMRMGAIDAKPSTHIQGIPALMASLQRAHGGFEALDHLSGGPTVNLAGVQTSMAQLAALQGRINALHDRTVTITTRQVGGNAPINNGATGGFIRGPGTTTSDSIPAMLSDKEFVVRAAAVSKYGVDMLHNINAMRYAKGGMVGASPVTNSTTTTMSRAFSVNFTGPITTYDVNAMARATETRFRDALALAASP